MSRLKLIISRLLRGRQSEHHPDFALLTAIGLLIVFGLIMLSSASSAVAYVRMADSYYYFKHQLVGLAVGLAAFWFFGKVDYHLWQRYAFWFLLVSVGLLTLVFIPGLSAAWGKSRSWINVFGYSLQPSELVKISFLLYLAAWLQSREKKLSDFSQGIGPFIAALSIIGILMIMQPDVGTLFIIIAASLVMYFVGGGSIKHILVIILFSLAGLYVMVQIKPYQMDRFLCLADPLANKDQRCYQTNQSLIAIGSGGWWGRGLGASRQKFLYLPEASGDSIFAVIGEEAGFVISGLLLMVYLFLFYRGAVIARLSPDSFGRNLSIGIVSWLVIQAMVNIGGMVNILPMTGVPLPYISYGGTAILAALVASGILVNISKQTRLR